jgi:hypothetical protein
MEQFLAELVTKDRNDAQEALRALLRARHKHAALELQRGRRVEARAQYRLAKQEADTHGVLVDVKLQSVRTHVNLGATHGEFAAPQPLLLSCEDFQGILRHI